MTYAMLCSCCMENNTKNKQKQKKKNPKKTSATESEYQTQSKADSHETNMTKAQTTSKSKNNVKLFNFNIVFVLRFSHTCMHIWYWKIKRCANQVSHTHPAPGQNRFALKIKGLDCLEKIIAAASIKERHGQIL